MVEEVLLGDHPSLAQRHQLDEDALVVARRVDRQAFHRLVDLAVDATRNDLRFANRQGPRFVERDRSKP